MKRKLLQVFLVCILIMTGFMYTGPVWGQAGPLGRFEEYDFSGNPPKRVFYVPDYDTVRDIFQTSGINDANIVEPQVMNYRTPYCFFDVYYPGITSLRGTVVDGDTITINIYNGDNTFKSIPLDSGKISKIHSICFSPEDNPDKFIQKKKTRRVSNSINRYTKKGSRGKGGQDTVMNKKSANEVAYRLGLPQSVSPYATPDPGITDDQDISSLCVNWGYDWLHLSAVQFGGIDKEIPEDSSGVSGAGNNRVQQARNLVLGTKAANTQMIIHEDIIADVLKKQLTPEEKIILNVTVDCAKLENNDFTSWFAARINYECYLGKKKDDTFTPVLIYRTAIDPFETFTPSVAEYDLNINYYKAKGIQPAKTIGSVLEPYQRGFEQYAVSFKQSFNPGLTGIRPSGPYMHNAVYCFTPGIRDILTNPYKNILAGTAGTNLLFEYPSDGFVFSELFENFECEVADQFIFDDVSIRIEEEQGESGTDNIIVFEGTLRMDAGTLAAIGTFLHMTSGIRMSARINIGNQVFSGKIEPKSITLRSEAGFHFELTPGITLTRGALQVSILKNIDYTARERKWSIVPYISGSVLFSNLQTARPVDMDFLLSYSQGTLHASAFCDKAKGLFGMDNLTLENFQANFDIGDENNIDISGYLLTESRTYGMGGKISSNGSGLYVSVDRFTVNDLAELFTSVTAQTLSLPGFEVQFNDVLIGIASDSCSIGEIFLDKGVTLQGTITVHGLTCKGKAYFSGNMISFTGNIGTYDFDIVRLKEAYVDMRLYAGKGVEFTIGGSATIQGIDLACKVSFEKYMDEWNCVLYGALEGDDLSFSRVFPGEKESFLDCLSFSRAAFVIATKDCKTQDENYSFTVRKGLQLMAVLEEIPVLSQLTGSMQTGLELCAYFGTGVDITIAVPDTRLQLGDFIRTDPFKIRVALAPEPAFSLVFGMDVVIINQPDPLHFDMVLDLGPLEANGSATMKGYWENPFGIQGLRIGPECALEIGINYAQFATTLTPSTFGIAGGLAVGDVEAQMAFRISSTSAQQILAGHLSQLTPGDLIKFVNAVTNTRLTMDQIPDCIDFRDIDIYIAPLGGSIGTITFEPGISFAGRMTLFGKSAQINARLNDNGFVAKGHIDKIEIGPLTIRGKNGKNAELDIELTTAKQSIYFDGAVELLGSSIEAFVDISASGIMIELLADLNLCGFPLGGDSYIHVTDEGIQIHGQIQAGESTIDVTGYLLADGSFLLKGDGDVTISGITLGSAHMELSNSELSLKGNLTVGSSTVEVSGNYTSPSNFSLSGKGNITINGITLASGSATFSNAGISVKGKVTVGSSTIEVNGSYTSSSNFSLSGKGNITINGFTLAGGSATFSNAGISVKGKVTVGNNAIEVNGSYTSPSNFTLTGSGKVSIAGYTITSCNITFSQKGISGSGNISFAGITFGVSFSVQTNGGINGKGSVNVGPFSLRAFDQEVGKLSGKVTLSVSNSEVNVSNSEVSVSFSGSVCILGACDSMSGSVSTSGVITFTKRVCVVIPVLGESCSTQCTTICIPECSWGESCTKVCAPIIGCHKVCTPVLKCRDKCTKVCVNVCVPVIKDVKICENIKFEIDLL
ncbi:MAG: hypothetical protein JXB88_24240 [Spirochaetales bacterium]|nr:hypothetical protein [Spirochaetales bacterium]